MELFATILELVGTVAFAASGALTAMKKHMDLLGIIVLAVITSVGGGVIRDLILGNTPPMVFRDPTCTMLAIATAIVLFIPWLRRPMMHKQKLFDLAMLVMDSLGLGIFTVMGIWIALDADPNRSTFLLVFVGVITGVGGGILRDILAGDTPYILVKHVYACASLAGALSCALLCRWLPHSAAMLISVALVLLIRLFSAHFRWNLPRVNQI